jgi:RNA polymerase sigma-70 factor (ECF subfamily)
MDDKTHAYLQQRTRLFGIAYRMLGSRSEAEDAVQDVYLKWHQADPQVVRSSEAFLVSLTTRTCIDRLRRLKAQRSEYFGPWLPEPLHEADYASPQARVELADDISIAFLSLLEKLSPQERAAFLLREVFDFEYREIAQMLGKSEAACRQMHARARERLRSDRPRFQVSEAAHRRLLEKFARAAELGDRAELMRLFAEEATFSADGGGKGRAVFKVLYGRDRISRLFLAVANRVGKLGGRLTHEHVRINGQPGLLRFFNGALHSAVVFETDGHQILAAYAIANPEKLEGFKRPLLGEARDLHASAQ